MAAICSAKLVVADRLAVRGHPLVDPLEVGAGVRADGQALGHQQSGDHLRRRALAVRAGDVDDRVGPLRVAHRADDSRVMRSAVGDSMRPVRS